MFTVDGMEWNFPCDIERITEMTESEISGMLLNKQYFNDVIGTYLKYTVTLVVPFGHMNEYSRLHGILTEPVESHVFVLPYNQTNITINARVASISDVYRRMADGSAHWKGIKFDVISNNPIKTQTLGEAITRGIASLPDISGAQEGVPYIYNGTEWVEADYQNADEIAY